MEKNARTPKSPPAPLFQRGESPEFISPPLKKGGRGDFRFSVIAVALAVGLTGCRKAFEPTYPASKQAESVVQICAKDYKRLVQARRADKSLQIMISYMGDVESDLTGIEKKASDVLEDLLQAGTRVALSTEDPPEFIEVFLRHPVTGTAFGIWRYVGDVRRFMHTDFPTLESVERMVMVRDQVDLDAWPPAVSMSEFLARQIVQRVKRQAGVEAREDLSEPGVLGIVVEDWSAFIRQETRDRVMEMVGQSSKSVLESYRFQGFSGVVLRDGKGAALKRWAL